MPTPLLFVLLPFLHAADPTPPSDTDAPPATTPAVEEPVVEAQAPPEPEPEPEPDRLIWSAEPLGQGDDRVATRIEAWLAERQEVLTACRDDDSEAGRILSTILKLTLDGTVQKVRATLSTGDRSVDTCALDILETLTLDPAPMFGDRLRVNLRWAPADAED